MVDRRHAGEGRLVVRQRVGLLEPADRPDGAGPGARAGAGGRLVRASRRREQPRVCGWRRFVRRRCVTSTCARACRCSCAWTSTCRSADGAGHRRRSHPRRAADDHGAARPRRARSCSARTSAGPTERDPKLSLTPVSRAALGADRASACTRRPRWSGPRSAAVVGRLEAGELLVLENLRFEPGETKNDPELAARAGLARPRPTWTTRSARLTAPTRPRSASPSSCGPPWRASCWSARSTTLDGPDRGPRAPARGGARRREGSDKIALIDRFLEIADTILIGGAMCFSFFRAQGKPTGNSLVEEEGVELARKALEKAESSDCRLLLPLDLVLGDRFDADAERRELDGIEVPDGWMGLDVGPRTVEAYAQRGGRRRHACSGTARWAPSRWSRSRPARAPWPRPWPTAPARRSSAAATRAAALAAVRPGRQRHAPLDRRRRVARAARGQGAARSGGAGRRLSAAPTSRATGRCSRPQAEARGYVRSCCAAARAGDGVDVALCVPYTALAATRRGRGRQRHPRRARRTCTRTHEGAFTGEISRADAARARRERRGARPLRAAPVLRRDRPRARRTRCRRRWPRVSSRSCASARARTSASRARPSGELRHQVQEALERVRRRATSRAW